MPVLGQSASCESCGKAIRSDDVSAFVAEHQGHDVKPKAASKPKAARKPKS